MAFNLQELQNDIRAAKLDGWLFYDFRGRDPIAHRILALPPGMRTRRWFYFVPAKGTPRKLVHKIETESLAAVPGETLYYAGYDELRKNLAKAIGRAKVVAMQYSPKAAVPYVAMVDGGTIELVRGAGAKVVSSADLVQKFEACWTPQQLESHLAAGKIIDRAIRGAFEEAAKHVRAKQTLTEYDLQQWFLKQFEASGIQREDGPDVAVNANASDPHYAPMQGKAAPIREGDLLLLDVWGKTKDAGSVYYDVTWMGYVGAKVPEKYAKVFGVLRDARDKAVDLIRTSVAAGKPLQGWQVDKAARTHHRESRLRKIFLSSAGAQHRGNHPRKWREHGQPRNARHPPPDSEDVYIDRARNLHA